VDTGQDLEIAGVERGGAHRDDHLGGTGSGLGPLDQPKAFDPDPWLLKLVCLHRPSSDGDG